MGAGRGWCASAGTLTLVGGLVAVAVVRAVAQAPDHSPARPDFSGHWVLNVPRAHPTDRSPVCGLECVIEQDDKQLRAWMTDVDRNAPNYAGGVYTFDGLPTVRTVRASGQTGFITMTVRWEGATLVIARSIRGSTDTTPLTSEYRLSLQGGLLIIEGTRSPYPNRSPKFRYEFRRKQDLRGQLRR